MPKVPKLRCTTIVAAALLCVGSATAQSFKAPLCPIDYNGRLVDARYEGTRVSLTPLVQGEYERIILTVRTPCSIQTRTFKPGQEVVFDIREAVGELDGAYNWELTVVPKVDPDVRKALNKARNSGDMTLPLELQKKGLLPKGPFYDSADFMVVDGQIADPTLTEERGKPVSRLSSGSRLFSPGGSGGGSAAADLAEGAVRQGADDFVIIDDLIVDGSACIGFDCVNGEPFGFDTIRIKENNLRIKFDDTSTAASFPRNDWQLTANDSANGGASKFSIDDISNSRTPFTVEANARSHSLYVDDGGRIGSRTSTPSVEIHTIDGDTPTLRLQQDGSSGFAPQTWDVAGNETNFFVRDVTNGSTLPLRIRPGAPSSAIFIDVDGSVGIGTSSPSQALHVQQNGDAQVFVEDTSSTTSDRILLNLQNKGGATLRLNDTDAFTWDIIGKTGMQFSRAGSGQVEMLLSSGGNLTITGDLVTGGSGTCAPPNPPCDGVFSNDYQIQSIEEHASSMWENHYLPAVGPTSPGEAINLTTKTTSMLNELEMAHIYIEQLNERIKDLEQRLDEAVAQTP